MPGPPQNPNSTIGDGYNCNLGERSELLLQIRLFHWAVTPSAVRLLTVGSRQRTACNLRTQRPERSRIGIFNRSCYEEVLVVRVHPEALAREKIPDKLVGKHIWKERFKDIRSFERYLARNGTRILKFHLRHSRHA